MEYFIKNAGSSLEIWNSIVGQKITHKSNGTGTIVGIEKNNDGIYVKVQFRAQVVVKYLGETLLRHFTHLTFPREVGKALETAHVNKGDFDRAIVNYNQVMQRNPDDAKAHAKQGLAYYNKGEYDRAIEYYNKAIQLKPDLAEAYNNRGVAYRNKGDFDRAIKDYNKVIQLKPDLAEAYNNRGAAYRNKDDFDRAIKDCNRAIQLKPNYAEAYSNRGDAYRNKGDFDRAIEDYNKALKLKPDYAQAYNNRIEAYRDQSWNSKKEYLLNKLREVASQPSIDPSNADAFNTIYGRLMKMNRKRKLSEQTIQEMNEYRQKLMVGIWNFETEDLLNQLKYLASQPSVNPLTFDTFDAKYNQLMKMHPEQKLPEQTIQEINGYRQKLIDRIRDFETEDLLRQLGDLASQSSIDPSTLNTFDAKYNQLVEMHPEQKLPEQTIQEINGYRQKLIGRMWFSDLSEKAMRPDVAARFPLPELNEHDLQLVEKWWHRPPNDLDRMSLIKGKSTNWDLGRLLSARSAEKVAVDFYQNYGKTVEDISITQIDENSKSDWRNYDLNVDGIPIDVKNSRKSQNGKDRYTEHCIPRFKSSRVNQEVTISGVFSHYLWAFELLDEPTEFHEDAEIQFLGETTRAKQEALKKEFGLLGNFESPNSTIDYFLPPWVFDYPEYVYTERDKALKELKDFPNFAFLKGATFKFNLIPVAIAAGIDLAEILDNEALNRWEWSFLNQLRNRMEKYGLSLPFLFLTILAHFLDMVAPSKTVSDFEPDKYRKFLFSEESDKPLGIYDPLKTVDALIGALSILQTAEDGLIRKFCTFRLKSFNILQGKSDPKDRLWTTLIAYCGGKLPKDGSACGKNPLILGESKLCECRRLICPECDFCCPTCKGETGAWGIH